MPDNVIGTIKIDAKMETRGIVQDSATLARATRSLESSISQAGKRMNASMTGYGAAMRASVRETRNARASLRELYAQAAQLEKKMGEFERQKFATQGLKDTQKEIERVDKALQRMYERQAKMDTFGQSESKALKEIYDKARGHQKDIDSLKQSYIEAGKGYHRALSMLQSGRNESGQLLSKQDIQDAQVEGKMYSDRMHQIETSIKNHNTQLKKLKDDRDKLVSEGKDRSPQAQSLDYDIKKMEEYAAKLKDTRDKLAQEEGKGFVFGDATEQYDALDRRLEDTYERIRQIRGTMGENFKPPFMQAWENMPRITGMISEGFGRIQNAAAGAGYALLHPFQTLDRVLGFVITKAGQAVSALAKMVGKGVVSYLKRLASEARNAAIQLAKLAANAVSSGLKRIASGAFQAAKGMLGLNKQSRRSRGNLGQSLKMVLKYAFGVRSMFFLFRRLRRAISDGFGELKKQNPAVKSAMDSLSKSASALKGSLAAAFAPIVTAIAPALTKLMDMLTNAINTIGAFFAALTGQKTVAKSIGKISDESKKATKSAKQLKKELLGFDELNVLGDKDSNSGSSGSDSGLSYKNVPIESGIKDFADRIKALWEKGDYEGLGNAIAGYINKAMDKANELISWGNVESKVRQGVTAIAGVFNGLTDPEKGVNFAKIGSTVSEGVNTILRSLDLLILAVKWGNVGAGLANFFNGLFGKEETWEAINTAITDAIDAVRQFAQAFVDTFDEGALARGILAALGDEATWTGLAKDAWNVIKKAFNKTGNFFNVLFGGTDYNEEQGKLSRMLRKRPADITPEVTINDQLWKELAANLGKRMNAALGKLAELIDKVPAQDVVDAVFDWFDTLVTNAIGEGSELGGVIGGLFNKVLEAVGTFISNWQQNATRYGNRIAATLRGIARNAFKSGNSPAKIFSDGIKGAFNFIQGFLDGFDPVDAANQLIDAVNDIDWDGIADAAWNAFKTAVEKLGSFLTVLFGGETEDPNFSRMLRKRPAGVGKQDGIASGVSNVIATALNGAFKSVTSLIEAVNWEGLGKTIGAAITGVDWKTVGKSFWDAFKELFSDLVKFLEGVAGGDSEGGNGSGVATAVAGVSAIALLKKLPSMLGLGKAAGAAGGAGIGLGPFLSAVGLIGGAGVLTGNKVYDAIKEKYGQVLDDLYTHLAKETTEFIENRTFEDGETTAGTGNGLYDAVTLALFGKDTLLDLADKVAENTDAVNDNTEEQPENPDVIGDLAKYYAEKTAEALQGNGAAEETPIMSDEEAAKLFEELGAEITASQEESAKTWGDAFKEAWDEGHTDEDWAEMMRYAQKLVEDGKTNEEILAELADADRPEQIAALSTAIDSLRQSLGGEAPRSKIGAKEQLEAQGDKTAKRSTRQSKLQTRQEKLLTAALKKKKDAELTVNHKINGIAEGEDKPTVDVGVKFAPEGEEPTDENTNNGLLGWLETLFGPGISVIAEVFALLTGKDPKSLSIADIFDTILTVFGFLSGKSASGSSTIGGLFGTLLEVGGKLLGNPASGSKTIGGLFGTLLEVVGALTGQKTTGTGVFATLSALFGTWFGVSGALTGQKTSGTGIFASLSALFGTWFGVSGALTGQKTTGTGIFASLTALFGSWFGVKSGLSGTTNGGQNWFTSLGGLFGTMFGVKSGLNGTTNGGQSWFTTLGGLFGTTFGVKSGLSGTTNGGSNWFTSLVGLFGSAFGVKSGLTGTTNGGSNWFTTLGGLFGTSFGTKAGLKGTTNGGSGWFTTLIGLFGSSFGVKSGLKGKTDGGSGWSKTLEGLFGSSFGTKAGIKGVAKGSLSLNDDKVFGSVANFAAAISTTAKKFVGGIQGVVDEYQTDGKNPVKIGGALKNMTGKKVVGDVQSNVNSYQEGDKNKVKIGGALKGVAGKTVVKDVQDNVDSYQSLGANPVKIAGVAKAKASEIVSDTQSKVDKYQNKSTDNLLGIGGKVGTSGANLVSNAQSNVNSSNKSLSLPATVDVQESNIKTAADKLFNVIKTPINTVWRALFNKNLFNAVGGIITNTGKVTRFANGGSIMRNGRASWWNSVNKYASGTMGAHGTVFVAGENGPEIMGHVNGRTEILNKSQLADAMYGAVVSGMAQAVNALGAYIAGHMTTCTNAIVSTIASKADLVVGRLAYYEPAMANGGIMPYDVSAQIARSTQEIKTTLNDNNEDLIQAMVSALGSVGMQIVTAIQQQTLRNGAQNGASAQQVMGAINRQTLMFGTNPLKGV